MTQTGPPEGSWQHSALKRLRSTDSFVVVTESALHLQVGEATVSAMLLRLSEEHERRLETWIENSTKAAGHAIPSKPGRVPDEEST